MADTDTVDPNKAPEKFKRGHAANPFKVGDVVHLKSGGPDMTVTAVDVENNPALPIPNIGVAYFVGDKMESTLGPAGIFKPSTRQQKMEKPRLA